METAVTFLRGHAALATQVAQPATPAPKPTAAADESLFEILSVDPCITESNNVWWKYAYIVEVQNTGDKQLLLNVTIGFLDADGFGVDDDYV